MFVAPESVLYAHVKFADVRRWPKEEQRDQSTSATVFASSCSRKGITDEDNKDANYTSKIIMKKNMEKDKRYGEKTFFE